MLYNNTYQLIIIILYLNGHDNSFTNNLKGGEVMGIIMFLRMSYFFDIIDMLKILMIIVR